MKADIFLFKSGIVPGGGGESRRLIASGAVKINGRTIKGKHEEIVLASGDVIEIGRARHGRQWIVTDPRIDVIVAAAQRCAAV